MIDKIKIDDMKATNHWAPPMCDFEMRGVPVDYALVYDLSSFRAELVSRENDKII